MIAMVLILSYAGENGGKLFNKQNKNMNILIACEESQTTMQEFRKLGHNAYSCDIQKCSGNFPQYHIQDDIFNVINDSWDIMIGHPPCTFLSFAGAGYYNVDKYGQKAIEREKEKQKAIEFFLKLWSAPVKYICLENPKGYIQQVIKQSQVIQPYYFGESQQKTTLLWLKNLPKLVYSFENNLFEEKTSVEKPTPIYIGKKNYYFTESQTHKDEATRRRNRSKSFTSIAKAMAQQWGNINN